MKRRRTFTLTAESAAEFFAPMAGDSSKAAPDTNPAPAPVRVTKATSLDCGIEWSAGKAGFGAGKLASTSDAKALGAITARSTRMNPDPLARAMRRDKQDRSVRISYLPGKEAA